MSKLRAFTMPKWGIEMTEGTIAEWMVKEGESFTKGQILCLIETSKITNEVEAEYDAVAHRLLIPAGGEAEPVGALLAIFGDADANPAEIDAFIATFRPAGEAGMAAPSAPEPAVPSASLPPPRLARRIETNRPISPEALRFAQEQTVELDTIEGSGRNGRITLQDVMHASRPPAALRPGGSIPLMAAAEPEKLFVSPLAQRIATQHGVDLSGISGTGPRGRICKADVLALIQPDTPSSALGQPFIPVDNSPAILPMDKIRKVVAQRLTTAKQTIPHFYLRMQARVDALLDMRKTANLILDSRASINDYLVRAVAIALARHPDVNIQVHGESIHRFPHADVAIAVASPSGLVTPIVRQADRMRVDQIALETRRLIDKAQAGKLGYQDMDGGTFSISNLGMFGIDQFDAIINPPQGAILAVGAILRQENESRMALSLSCDHRAIDGALGARFMATLRELIEAPEALFRG